MNNTTINRRAARRGGSAALAALLLFALAACGSDSSDETNAPATTSGGGSTLTVSDAWARNSAMMQGDGAAYLQITGGASDDELIGATVPSSVAASVELHESSMGGHNMGDMDMGDMDMGDMDMGGGGMMTMKQVPSIAVPAGEVVSLEPGGFHLMLINLAAPLVEGETFELALEFASGAKVSVPVEVRANR